MIVKDFLKAFLAYSLILFFLVGLVYGYSTFGAPSAFGNATNTTCFIGGDEGILNCTGPIITASYINSSNYQGQATYLGGVNCDNINFSGTIGAPNICDGDDATGGGGGGSGGNSKWVDNVNYLEPNATFAVNVNITGDLKIQGSGDFICSSCINPEDINDIDDEDIESDLNTYVDIGGDTMTGDFLGTNTIMSGEINSSEGFYYEGQLLESTTANITSIATTAPITGGTVTNGAVTVAITQSDTSTNGYLSSTDWDTFNNKGSVTGVSATSPIASTGGTSPTISISLADTSTNGYLSSTDWNTFNGKSSYTAADDAVGSITEWDSECTDCVGTDDLATNACDNNALIASPTFTSPIIDVSLKPDAAGGATLGTAATEWGAIFVGDNDKINLGDSSDAQIYFDGSRLVIKVTS